jgi:hypothetical protein
MGAPSGYENDEVDSRRLTSLRRWTKSIGDAFGPGQETQENGCILRFESFRKYVVIKPADCGFDAESSSTRRQPPGSPTVSDLPAAHSGRFEACAILKLRTGAARYKRYLRIKPSNLFSANAVHAFQRIILPGGGAQNVFSAFRSG